jgi:hypothetical protein
MKEVDSLPLISLCQCLPDATRRSEGVFRFQGILRKEVIQPQVPLRLPCYDLVPVIDLTVGAPLPCGLGSRLRVLSTSVA